ncbi:MAG: aspartate--tRNA ligase [Candidatus Edwardsbacteria bacterium]|nr:aspartate--tRNA ligase [Candidatus Edwardsbacteria bacterium]MBU1575700.1 aspartate--tRNA ligase [Candidatus Edwardsbacteria bacterium]MBU2464095.1 aspartate--tRNA ligase [Candidatus Edwardsbacteria bacterium]MBU2594665.1 aspartate--tRNA ligase [Candidatus Edwardsbacteria bacterium]
MKLETLGNWERTHTCGELRSEHIGQQAILCGWVHRSRNHGGLIFINLRDRYGITQVVFDPAQNAELTEAAKELKSEYVIAVKGAVRNRPQGQANTSMATGVIEVLAGEVKLLNSSAVPPFVIEDQTTASEDLRLKFRYLDLRRPALAQNIILRHNFILAVRNYLSAQNFLEIETPLLTRSTPEGARDYLVPCRVQPGKFYALPQSPQIYKQILMVAGFDKYFQIARCLRDEDLRADRQPEHTQIDIEMSFATQDKVFAMAEGMFKEVFSQVAGIEIQTPFPRLAYAEAMNRFGSDKPDMRFGLELCDIAAVAAKSEFTVFKQALENKGQVKGICVPGGGKWSRKDIGGLTEFAKIYGAKGLAWAKVSGESLEGSIAKFFVGDLGKELINVMSAKDGDIMLFVADQPSVVFAALGALRVECAKRMDMIPKDKFAFAWITDFPLFHYNQEEKCWVAEHHMFSMPREEHLEYLETDPGKVLGQLYDLVANGSELASGSIRIHRRDIQEKVMKVVGLSPEEATKKFGFLLEAFEYGAPPHGGIAPGLDRILTMITGGDSIRDVIAFPKTTSGSGLMEGSPSEVDERQLKDLHIKTI